MPKLKSNVLQVEINGKPVVSVGLKRQGNGTVIIGCYSHSYRRAKPPRPLQSISAGALEVDDRETNHYLHYLEHTELSVGDVVTVRVLKSGKLSVPRSQTKESKGLRRTEEGGPRRHEK